MELARIGMNWLAVSRVLGEKFDPPPDHVWDNTKHNRRSAFSLRERAAGVVLQKARFLALADPH